jgi:nucleoside-diphosphate-sugar epimerase
MKRGATDTDGPSPTSPEAPGGLQGVRVLVTGGASFIGSHLVGLLCESGAEVTVADDFSSGKSENLTEVIQHVLVLEGDLRDANFAEKACAQQELVFHFAASHGGRGYIDTHPVECVNNVVLDHLVFSAAARAGTRKVIYASSACVYPTSLQASATDRLLLAEEDSNFEEPGKAFADGEYGWAKLMGELQLRSFHKQYGLDAVACRIFTAYGERENESHSVIALVAKALAKLDPYPVWGDGTQTRNFTYVADTAKGVLLSALACTGFEVMNVGSSTHVTINELIGKIFEITGWAPSKVEYELDKPVGVLSRAADVTKSERVLGWHPQIPLDVGLSRTISWYEDLATAQRLSNLDALLMSR